MKSNTRPWVRGGLLGLVPLLLPFVWVVEVNSCGSVPTETEYTGLQIISKFDWDFWALFVPVVVVCVAMPLLAARLIVPLHRMLFQILGAVATLLAAYLAGLVLFFAIFSDRRAQGVGWLVLALFFGSVADALWRLGWSVQEFRASRKAPVP